MLLNSDYSPCLTGGFQHSLAVERLYPRHVENAGADAFLCKQFGSLAGMIYRFSCSYQCDVTAVGHGDCFAGHKLYVVGVVHLRHSGTSHPDVAGQGIVGEQSYKAFCHMLVTGQTNTHSRECAQHGYVVQGVMGCAECAICHTAAHT